MIFGIFKTKGHSMEPSLRNGSFFIVSSITYFFSKPKAGDIVLFDSISKSIVKKIKKIDNGKYVVEGENLLDSKKFEPIERKKYPRKSYMEILAFAALILALILLIPISWIWPPDSPWAPWWRTKEKTAKKAFEMAKVDKKDIVYELGSGEATALIVAAKKFGAKGVGIEIDPVRFYLSKFTVFRKGLNKEVKLIKGDLFKEDLSGATVVYVYLVPKTLNKLIPKFKKELKKRNSDYFL